MFFSLNKIIMEPEIKTTKTKKQKGETEERNYSLKPATIKDKFLHSVSF